MKLNDIEKKIKFLIDQDINNPEIYNYKELLKNKEEEAAYAGRRGSTVCWDDVIITIKNTPTVEPEILSCGSGNLVDAENGTRLVGKTITEEDIDGFGIELKFTDGSVFTYSASDGGCSSWDFDSNEEDDKIKGMDMPKWIPCSERLPEPDDWVLCCTAMKTGRKYIVIGYYTGDRWVCGMNSNVIAWQPLPDPYEGEKND